MPSTFHENNNYSTTKEQITSATSPIFPNHDANNIGIINGNNRNNDNNSNDKNTNTNNNDDIEQKNSDQLQELFYKC